MNDLSGLSWNANLSNPAVNRNGAQFANIRQAPSPSLSRQPTPLSAQQSGRSTPAVSNNGPTKMPAQDSFSNLLGSTATRKTNSLSLQERQKQLLEEKARQAAAQHSQYNSSDAQFWEGLGSGRSTPGQGGTSKLGTHIGHNNLLGTDEEEDILAAFNASAPVDASSHFPPSLRQEHSLDNHISPRPSTIVPSSLVASQSYDDDDPFGLGQMSQPQTGHVSAQPVIYDANDDILGLLGQPVPQIPSRKPIVQSPESSDDEDVYEVPVSRKKADPRDAAIAEIVDMGFSVRDSREALEHTSSGTDVQAAVGWLLNKAHEDSKSKSRTPAGLERDNTSRGRPSRTNGKENNERANGGLPPWIKEGVNQQRPDSRSPASLERDVTQYATEIGSSLFKSANSLLKATQRKAQKAMADYQETEHSQPKWMRAAREEDEQLARRQLQEEERRRESDLTNEAMLLESGRSASAQRTTGRTHYEVRGEIPVAPPLRRASPQTPLFDNRIPQRTERPQVPVQSSVRPVERLRKQIIEEESAQAYISPARRKKATPKAPEPDLLPESLPQAQSRPEPEPELDIFSDITAPILPTQPTATPRASAPTSRSSTPLSVRPKVPARQAPAITPSALSTSTIHRQKGTEAFKRGDYGSAQTSYTAALAALPPNHPIMIILYCNRALTNSKTGNPKDAIIDADAALAIIGPSRGDGESISLGAAEGDKPMKEFYGKALMRKAEALEHMEKWTVAAGVWREAVEAGVGGSVSIQGRNRCEKAANPAPKPSSSTEPSTASRPTASKATTQQRPKPATTPASRMASSAPPKGAEAEAVLRLRAANAAAAAASDEAFALNDAVEARIASWKTGKEGNLRALLASLDAVLWADAGWKKVGMGDLVMPGKVKIVYMKAIAKCHPDKIPQTATTEQRMVSASVFATLNEAWDKFKKDNGM